METVVQTGLIILAAYLAAGLLFAVAFLLRGITAVDEGTRETGIGFRSIILPGIILLWPVLLRKWLKLRVPERAPGKLQKKSMYD